MMKKAAHLRIVPRLAAVGALGLAAVLLGSGTALAAVASQVQSGTVANAANGTQVVNISGIDPAKSFLIFETRHAGNRPVASLLRGRIPIACANPCTTIEFVRVTDEGAPATINIQWYVVTFASGVRVQRGETPQDSLAKDVTLPLTLSAVNQAFVLWSKTTDAAGGEFSDNETVLGEITSTTTVQFRSTFSTPFDIITWQVVEFTNAADINVQKGTTAMLAGTTSVTATLSPAVDENKTFVLAGFMTTGTGVDMGSRMLRAELTDSTTITIQRSVAGTPDNITEIFWQAIELKDKSTVVRGSSTFAAAVAQVTVPIAPHLDVSQSIAFGSVQSGAGQNLGRSPYVADDIIGVGSVTMALSATQLTLDRNNTAATAEIDWFIVEFEQEEAKVLSGSYTGNGVDNRPIDVGFLPDFVIVKTTGQIGVFRTSTMAADPALSSKSATGATALVANRIQSFDAVGGGRFVVGTNLQVNGAGAIYYWTAFKAGAGKMAVGTYTGSATLPVAVTGLGFSPEAVFVMAESARNPVFRLAGMANSTRFTNDAGSATRITGLDANGFTVGTDLDVNGAVATFHYVAWNEATGWMDVGSYAGNAPTDNRNITGVGFPPELVIVKNVGAQLPVLRPRSLDSVADSSANFSNVANAANKIQALQTDGFQVGTNIEVNENLVTHHYVAWARAQQPMILTGDYPGDAVDNRVISGVGFQPDVVIVKGNNAQVAVIRTSTMVGDLAKPMVGGLALAPNLIQSLDPSGFTIGTDATVNSNVGCPGTCMPYWFIAFKAAPGTMKVGTYTGNGMAGGQSITGVGFSPELLFIIPAGATEAIHRSSASTEAHNFSNSGVNPLWISSLNADGFTVTTLDAHVNANLVVYHYVAWNEIPGEMEVGTYVGNSTGAGNNDNRNITGVGFEPEYVIAKRYGAANYAVQLPASLGRSVDIAMGFVANANISPGNNLQALRPDGFQIGDGAGLINTNLATYVYYAWKRPQPAAATLTAVRLTAFDATRYDRGVLVQWRTGYEIDNLGFHVYREVNGRRTRVTQSLLAGSGLMAGQGAAITGEKRYALWDTAGPVDPSAVYWLEDRDFTGTSTWHGPVTPVGGGRAAPPDVTPSIALHDLGRGQGQTRHLVLLERDGRLELRGKTGGHKSALSAAAVVSAAEMQWTLAAQAAVKISVDRPGWYRLTHPELVAAGLAPNANAHTLRLFVDGVEQAMLVTGAADGQFDSADAIEFYGTGVDTPDTDTRAYWLVADSQPGRRVTVHTGTGVPAPPAGSFDFTLQQKERSLYFAGLRNGDAENWFGALVSEEPADLVFDLSHVDAGGAAALEIALQGVTIAAGGTIDHVVAIGVNGTELGELHFDGQSLGVQSFAIPTGLLTDGANTVTVVARGGEADISLVDLVRLRYAHAYRADADRLHFSAAGPGTITVGGFVSSAIRVIDITDPLAAEELSGTVAPDSAHWAVTVGVPGGGPRTLLAFTDATVAAPAFVRANRPSSWHAAATAADYVAVAHAAFADAIGPLVERRQQQGLSVARVDIEDVYDEFSFGQKTPQALKDFMRHARASWTLPPRFLLLVGDATIDPRDYAGFGDADFVPTKQVALDGVELETASDDWFVDVDDDGLPDVAIGRLPVRTVAQANTTVGKTLGYEAQGEAPWMHDVLFVADHEENAPGRPYETASRRLEALLPEAYRSHELFSSQLAADTLRQGLASQVADGRLIVNYSGHGSTQLWGVHGDLLGPDDINGWTNSRLPFVVAMNCLNGLFQGIYDEESLAETLLRAPQSGAVAVWASSGVTDASVQGVMTEELYRLIFQGGTATLGRDGGGGQTGGRRPRCPTVLDLLRRSGAAAQRARRGRGAADAFGDAVRAEHRRGEVGRSVHLGHVHPVGSRDAGGRRLGDLDGVGRSALDRDRGWFRRGERPLHHQPGGQHAAAERHGHRDRDHRGHRRAELADGDRSGVRARARDVDRAVRDDRHAAAGCYRGERVPRGHGLGARRRGDLERCRSSATR